ncbi:Fic family protein [Mucilaginibacter celer]|uniref:Fic family protein n=1 Tax=Mucilaginibacter celer TaxID=2305508 RepID=A0A494VPU1_9SPHI|nr:Fic family protein [Mucilaginibacter celer]AYL96309.1 Fic family protein [Mucilaginibacter celer]
MNLKLETEFSKAPILAEIDDLKKQVDNMRPLPLDVEGRVMQKLRLDWNYNSNAIEGNKLSYGETVAFLMEGITAKGKPLKDHLDIRGHNEAINFLLGMVKEDRPLSESDIRGLHEMILVEPYDVPAQTADGMPTKKRIIPGVYKTTANHVQTATGETHYYATPEETPAKMRELMEWYYEVDSNADVHPVVVAALFHHKFVEIHPFDDGNGRLSRILMNLVLLKKGYPPVVVKMDDRRNYYSLLSRADVGESWPFVEYVAERLLWSLELFFKGAKGEDIDEDEDIDKEIALLQIQLRGDTTLQFKKNVSIVQRVFSENIYPLSEKIIIKLDVFQQYFFASKNAFEFTFDGFHGVLRSSFPIDENAERSLSELLNESYLTELKEIDINIDFLEFKNHVNKFSLYSIVKVSFEDIYYNILINESLIVAKLYHENLSSSEEAKIIKEVIRQFKQQLEVKQKARS